MVEDKVLIDAIEEELSSVKGSLRAPGLYEPIAFTLGAGGKHLRPLMCLRACEALCSESLRSINQAVGLEMFHNFTLIHDDVMDGSDMRRGLPTVFAKNGATQAILSGDALLTLATKRVANTENPSILPQILNLFNTTALEVYEGQQLDINFESRNDVTTDEYLEMIRLKTSVLLGCSCAMGALVADRPETAKPLYAYGEKLGLAFQLRDDWLDTFGDAASFGKPIGGDIINRKKTWLFITALNEAPKDMAEALDCPDNMVVERVRTVYNKLNLSQRCDNMVQELCNNAIEALAEANLPQQSYKWFENLAQKLNTRQK